VQCFLANPVVTGVPNVLHRGSQIAKTTTVYFFARLAVAIVAP